MSDKNADKITVIASDLEGNRKTKHYKDMRKAREFAVEKLGGDFEIRMDKVSGNPKYAESTVKDTLVMVKNATLQELLLDPLPEVKSGKGKKARQGKCKDEVMEIMGLYIEDPVKCENLYTSIEDQFVIYKKKEKIEPDADAEPVEA